ncbi:putative nucleic acid-binding protein [Helianthus annuus]|nr:putative nucleic acid-binding protein [Helianthus annuus]
MSISVDSNNLSFVNDLNPGKDMWNMKARIIRKWNQGYKMEIIFIDEKGAKIQAGIKSHLIPVFYGQLQEDAVVILSKFGVAYEDILQGEALNALSVDVAGSVISCGDLEIFDRPPKETKKMNFEIEDLDGKVLRCTVWNDYALQIKDFISKVTPHEHVMAVIQHGKCEHTVQSDKFATRIFLNQEIDEVDELRRRMLRMFQMIFFDFLRLLWFVSDVILTIDHHKVQVRVQDESGSVSFVMFDRDVQKLLGLAASDIRERQVKDSDTGFPHEIFRLVDKKAAFKIDVSEFNLKNDYRVYTVQKTTDDPVIIAELVGGDGNGDENTDEVTQEVADVNLSDSSQVSAERTSRDAVSVTADSSVVEVEKDSGSSPNGKRMAKDADVANVGELSTNVRRTRKKLTKVNN